MPLPIAVEPATEALATALGPFTLMGIFLNPQTGEMGIYSSHGIASGAVLGFLQQAINELIGAMANGELELADGNDQAGSGETAQGTFGGTIVH